LLLFILMLIPKNNISPDAANRNKETKTTDFSGYLLVFADNI
jgi:hypothetical protein